MKLYCNTFVVIKFAEIAQFEQLMRYATLPALSVSFQDPGLELAACLQTRSDPDQIGSDPDKIARKSLRASGAKRLGFREVACWRASVRDCFRERVGVSAGSCVRERVRELQARDRQAGSSRPRPRATAGRFREMQAGRYRVCAIGRPSANASASVGTPLPRAFREGRPSASYGRPLRDSPATGRPLRDLFGGPEGTRTPDPLHAMQVRYQLRHRPMPRPSPRPDPRQAASGTRACPRACRPRPPAPAPRRSASRRPRAPTATGRPLRACRLVGET